jgi:hypothetical protein
MFSYRYLLGKGRGFYSMFREPNARIFMPRLILSAYYTILRQRGPDVLRSAQGIGVYFFKPLRFP